MLAPWINLKIETQASTDGSEIGDGRPVVYVLERHGLSNVLILERACHEAGLPSPRLAPPGDPLRRGRAYLPLSRRRGGVLPPGLGRLLAAHREYPGLRSEEHTSELQSLMRISYAVFCLKKKTKTQQMNKLQLT